jgi:uncharacterized OsmC-like protein
MGMTVVLDRMIHTEAVHEELGKKIGLEGCCSFGGTGRDLNPIDLMAMGLASCLQIVMAKAAQGKGLDVTGTWAETAYTMKDYKIETFDIVIHSPLKPSADDQAFLEKESHRCPVYLAVKDSVKVNVSFEWASQATPKAAAACSACCK